MYVAVTGPGPSTPPSRSSAVPRALPPAAVVRQPRQEVCEPVAIDVADGACAAGHAHAAVRDVALPLCLGVRGRVVAPAVPDHDRRESVPTGRDVAEAVAVDVAEAVRPVAEVPVDGVRVERPVGVVGESGRAPTPQVHAALEGLADAPRPVADQDVGVAVGVDVPGSSRPPPDCDAPQRDRFPGECRRRHQPELAIEQPCPPATGPVAGAHEQLRDAVAVHVAGAAEVQPEVCPGRSARPHRRPDWPRRSSPQQEDDALLGLGAREGRCGPREVGVPIPVHVSEARDPRAPAGVGLGRVPGGVGVAGGGHHLVAGGGEGPAEAVQTAVEEVDASRRRRRVGGVIDERAAEDEVAVAVAIDVADPGEARAAERALLSPLEQPIGFGFDAGRPAVEDVGRAGIGPADVPGVRPDRHVVVAVAIQVASPAPRGEVGPGPGALDCEGRVIAEAVGAAQVEMSGP